MTVRTLLIKPKRKIKVPVDAKCISPDKLSELTLEEVKKLRVYEGNRAMKLEDLFYVKEEGSESSEVVKLVLEGDFKKVQRVGEEMKSGEILIEGDIGHFLGFRMRGGSIVVKGNAGSWIGSEMRGGNIEIFGNVGDHVGAVLRGERLSRGMSNGVIIIHGNAGSEIGTGMRKGTIIVNGDCGYLPGIKMSGGSILIRGNCDGKAGARMTGGKIVICGRAGEVLPTFYVDSIVSSVKVKKEKIKGPFYLFIGDVLGDVKCGGRLYISVKNNEHLKPLLEDLLESST